MKFTIRELLLVTALICVAFALVPAYFESPQYDLHKRKQKWIQEIAVFEGNPDFAETLNSSVGIRGGLQVQDLPKRWRHLVRREENDR